MSKTVGEIDFETTESKTRLTTGKVCYRASITHREVLSPKATRERFAQYANLKLADANRMVDMLFEFVAEEIRLGHRLDFGAFSVELAMRGGFPSANAPFDSERNELAVLLKPGKELRAAAKELMPVNVTKVGSGDNVLRHEIQIEPPREGVDFFDATGVRRLNAACLCLKPNDLSGEGEGVWIENDAGVKVLIGTSVTYDGASCKFTLEGDIPTGSYWLVLCGRHCRSNKFMRLSHRITARAAQ